MMTLKACDGICKYPANEKLIQENSKNIEKILTKLDTYSEKVTITQASLKSLHKRVDSCDEHTKAIIDMSASIKFMGEKLGDVVEVIESHEQMFAKNETVNAVSDNVSKIDNRVKKVEAKDGQTAIEFFKRGGYILLALILGYAFKTLIG